MPLTHACRQGGLGLRSQAEQALGSEALSLDPAAPFAHMRSLCAHAHPRFASGSLHTAGCSCSTLRRAREQLNSNPSLQLSASQLQGLAGADVVIGPDHFTKPHSPLSCDLCFHFLKAAMISACPLPNLLPHALWNWKHMSYYHGQSSNL